MGCLKGYLLGEEEDRRLLIVVRSCSARQGMTIVRPPRGHGTPREGIREQWPSRPGRGRTGAVFMEENDGPSNPAVHRRQRRYVPAQKDHRPHPPGRRLPRRHRRGRRAAGRRAAAGQGRRSRCLARPSRRLRADRRPGPRSAPPRPADAPAVQPMAERRDESDRVLVRRLLERRLPVLAIGLGMQQTQRGPAAAGLSAPARGAAARHAAPRPTGGAAPPYRVDRAEHAHGGDLRRRRNPRQQRLIIRPCGRSATGCASRAGAGRRHRGGRGDRSQLVLRRRAVAPRIGDGLRPGPAAVRVVRAGVPAQAQPLQLAA